MIKFVELPVKDSGRISINIEQVAAYQIKQSGETTIILNSGKEFTVLHGYDWISALLKHFDNVAVYDEQGKKKKST